MASLIFFKIATELCTDAKFMPSIIARKAERRITMENWDIDLTEVVGEKAEDSVVVDNYLSLLKAVFGEPKDVILPIEDRLYLS